MITEIQGRQLRLKMAQRALAHLEAHIADPPAPSDALKMVNLRARIAEIEASVTEAIEGGS